MNTAHYAHWPAGLPHQLTPPATSVYDNLEISARRYPEKSALIFYGRDISYRGLRHQGDALAGYLQQVCGVRRGDRVLRPPLCGYQLRSEPVSMWKRPPP